jgi:hypothetical protein
MNHRKLILLASLVCATSLPVMSAHADSGVYIGAGLGQSNMKDVPGNPGAAPGGTFDETGTASKAFVGYYFDWIPLVKFAAEVGYRDLGKPAGTVGGVPVEYQASGFDYAALAGLGLGPVDLFARVGGMNYDLKKTVGGVTNDYTGNAPVYGIGIWFKIFGLGVRAEYDVIDIKQLDSAEMATVSVFYQF